MPMTINNKHIYGGFFIIGGIIAAIFLIVQAKTSQPIYLYAWERPEDFSFLDKNQNTNIVFYAGDIVIKNNKIITSLRRNKMIIPDGIKEIPLIRIDSFESPNVLIDNTDRTSDFIIKICSGFDECQIDFEARTSEYAFYSALLDKVRESLPNKNIVITSLASWCSGDLLNSFPVNNAVPMLYRMGKDGKDIKSGTVGNWFLSNPKCSDSIALSVDELDFNPRQYMRGKSVYLFNPEPWTRDSYKETLSYLGL